MAALVFLGTIAASAPSSGTGITAEQAMAHYRAVLNGAKAGTGAATCPDGAGSDIVVCGRDPHPQPRLPMPDQRAEPGEVVHHPSEPPPATGALNDKPQCQYNCGPSPAPETWGRLFKILKGDDPDD